MLGLFSKTIVGLDIGSSSVKVLQLKQVSNQWQLATYGIADLPRHVQENKDPELKNAMIAETIKKLFKEHGIKSKNVVTSLSGDAVIVRYVKLPFMTAEQLRTGIAHEAEQYIPLNIEQVILDFQILGEVQEEGQKMIEVLLVAAKIEVVDQHLKLLKAAGLTPVLIDVDAFALENTYEASRLEPTEETVALVNIGATLTTLNIIEGATTRFTRDVAVAGNDFTREIMKEFNLDFAEAEKLKRAHGAISVDEDDFSLTALPDKDDRVLRMSDTMTPVLNKLLGEIRRSFDYYETQSRKKTVERIILSGGTARLKNLNRFLANKLGIPVENLGVFRNVETSKARDAEQLAESEIQLGVCTGLAMRRPE